jgi:hypothetical protein
MQSRISLKPSPLFDLQQEKERKEDGGLGKQERGEERKKKKRRVRARRIEKEGKKRVEEK